MSFSYLISAALLLLVASSSSIITTSEAFVNSVIPHSRRSNVAQHNPTTALPASIKQRLTFNSPPPVRNTKEPPKLILISGGPGTGKSTFGMSLALEQGILKCISTDTVRAVMRSYVPDSISPPLHRSSYGELLLLIVLLQISSRYGQMHNQLLLYIHHSLTYTLPTIIFESTKILIATSAEDGSDDPVKSWKETCKVLESSVDGLVEDAIERGVSLVLEGVSIYPSRKWVDKFTEAGGTACGVLLVVSKEETHKNLLLKRGFMTGNTGAEQKKLKSFDRVRLIQDEMISAAKDSGWVIIEQRVDPDPLDVVADALFQNASCMMKDQMLDELEEDCVLNNTNGKTVINDLVKAEKAALAAAVADEAKEEIEI